MAEELELSIVMPCLNEEKTVGICIRKAKSFLEKHNIIGEVIISDNGSTDNSIEIAKKNSAKIVHAINRGYGSALMKGILSANGKYIIIGDSDDSYDFGNLMPFLERLRAGYELVMGNRFKGGIEEGAMPFLHKHLGNPFLSWLGRILFKIKIGDFHCGLRGFNNQTFQKLELKTTGMEFASEMIVKSSLMNLRMTEVPTTLSKDGRDRSPHLNTWRDGWRHLRFLLVYSPTWLFLYPGMTVFFVGVIFSSILLLSPIAFNNIVFDVSTLLYSSVMILIGYQIVMFYILSKVYGVDKGLLPRSNRYHYFFKIFSLEKGLIAGFVLVFIGLILGLISLNEWKSVGYGNLIASDILRKVIPSVIALAIGVQTIFYSFFLSMLKIR